jgi:SAM-dependent methyltransferase
MPTQVAAPDPPANPHTRPGFFQGTEMPAGDWWQALWSDPAGALQALGVAPGVEVIDLCSGDGWFTLPLARLARRVIAVDIDPAMLARARTRLERSSATNAVFLDGDAYEVKRLWPQPVDFVFLANAFHGVPDKPRLVRAVREVLKPGGRLAVVNWLRRPREETTVLGEPRGPDTDLRMSPEQTIAAVEPMLNASTIIELPPYHYGAVFRR